MGQVILGKTGIRVSRNGFGAIPIQRVSPEVAVYLLQKAYRNGFQFFDTARSYTDSEAKIGAALQGVRPEVVLATKAKVETAAQFWKLLEASLKQLQASYLDIFQVHTPAVCPKPGDGSGLYEAMLEARDKGLIRHIGLTNHRLWVAMEAAESGLYATVQYPFSYLATASEIRLVERCRELQVGFIAMKGLAGGLIKNAAAAYAFLAQPQYDHVLPIWGIEKESELDEFISFAANPPQLTAERLADIERDRAELSGNFCRGCGYCLPCPAGIEIPMAARMSLLIRRSSIETFTSDAWKTKMRQIEECTHCNHCKDNCPYGLDTPQLLADNWADYQQYL